MPKDRRLYATFTLDFPEHEKVLPLSDAAFRCLVEATIWSRKQKTDGWLARRLAVAKWSLDVLQELSTNDPVKPSLIESEDGWQIRDFDQHQDTKADIEARQERNRIAGQKGGLARAKQGAKPRGKRGASKPLSETQAKTTTDNSLSTDVLREGDKRAKGTRIPENWRPPADVIAQMRAEHPGMDFRLEHAKFIDYWRDQPGAKGRKVDWIGTWRNWMRRAAESRPRGPNGSHDDKVNGYLVYANQQPELEQ